MGGTYCNKGQPKGSINAELSLSRIFRQKLTFSALQTIINLGDPKVINENRYREYCNFLQSCEMVKTE